MIPPELIRIKKSDLCANESSKLMGELSKPLALTFRPFEHCDFELFWAFCFSFLNQIKKSDSNIWYLKSIVKNFLNYFFRGEGKRSHG